MLTTNLQNEKELLQLVSNGDESAYKILFTKYWDQIYSTALMFTKSSEMSEDLTQDVFAQIWIKREKLREVIKFEPFLFITARNLIFDRLRQKVLNCDYEQYLIEYFRDTSPSPIEKLELKEMEEMIYQTINNLPKQQQTAFRLSRFQGLKHEDIAVQMGISKESVKSHIVRAIYSLRKHLGERIQQLPLFVWMILFL